MVLFPPQQSNPICCWLILYHANHPSKHQLSYSYFMDKLIFFLAFCCFIYCFPRDKRYPIKLEGDQSEIYKGNKSFFIYAETSWEKESWCKALRLASSDKNKQITHCQLIKDFHGYLSLLNANYPSFLKPSVLLNETVDKQSKPGVPPSKVSFFLKKLAKKASVKAGLEGKSDGETKVTEKFDGAAIVEEKCSDDEGTLCLNLLFLRLFFDAQRSKEIGDAIIARIQVWYENLSTFPFGSVTSLPGRICVS